MQNVDEIKKRPAKICRTFFYFETEKLQAQFFANIGWY